MISPQPLKFLMKRRNTVSVTPAMGARMVAGAMRTAPKFTDAGTPGALLIGRSMTEFSQYLRMAAALILKQFVYRCIRQFEWKPPHLCGGSWTLVQRQRRQKRNGLQPWCSLPPALKRQKDSALSRSAEALLPPAEAGGFHHANPGQIF